MAKPGKKPDDLDLNATIRVRRSVGRVGEEVSDDQIDEAVRGIHAIAETGAKPRYVVHAPTPQPRGVEERAETTPTVPTSIVDSVRAPARREADRAAPPHVVSDGPSGGGFDPNKTLVVPPDRLYAGMSFEHRQRAKLAASRTRLTGILSRMQSDVETVLRERMELTRPLSPEKVATLTAAGEVLRIVEATTKRLSTKVKDAPDWEETSMAVNQLLIATLKDTLPAVREYLTPGELQLLTPQERLAIGEGFTDLETPPESGFFGVRPTARQIAEGDPTALETALIDIERDALGTFLRRMRSGAYADALPTINDIAQEIERERQVLMLWWKQLSTTRAERLEKGLRGEAEAPPDDAPRLPYSDVEMYRRAIEAMDPDVSADRIREFESALAMETERRTKDARFAVN